MRDDCLELAVENSLAWIMAAETVEFDLALGRR